MKQGWEYKKLGEVCNTSNGLWTGKKAPFVTVPVISLKNFSKDCKLKKDEYSIVDVEIRQFESRKLQYGDIIIEKSGGSDTQPVGRPIFFDIKEGDYSFSNFTAILRPNEDYRKYLDCHFLHYTLYSYYCQGKTFSLQSKTTGIHNLDMKGYLKLSIPIPPLTTQQSIVSELDTLSQIIAGYKEQLADYDKLEQSIFYDMFGDPVKNEKGWEVKKLGEFCEIGTGSTPSRKIEDNYIGDISWVKSTEVCNSYVKETQEHISQKAYDSSNCSIYPKGSVLMAMYGQGKTRGQVAILEIEACTNQAVAAIVPSKEIHTMFLYFQLHLMYNFIRDMANGCNQSNLNLNIVRSINIILPPLPLQQQFASKIESIEQMKADTKAALQDAELLFQARMDYWFNA